MTEQEVNIEPLTREEVSELELLRLLQADHTRWLSMWEFNRIAELANRQYANNNTPQTRKIK